MPDEKNPTRDRLIEVIMPNTGAMIVLPMIQHIGEACEPIVSVGDRVMVGQKIGEARAFLSSPVHASVSGVVKEIKHVLTPSGSTCFGVCIENDGLMEEHPSLGRNVDSGDCTRDEILNIIKEAGIVGLGGAGFPAHVKLNPPPDKKIDTIIVNAAECEPFLTTDFRVLMEEADKLVHGLQILLRLFPSAKGIIAIETNKPEALKKYSIMVKHIPELEVVALKPKYPQGSEKQLIYACKGRTVPSGKLPSDVGCIVHNADTVIAVDRAFVRGRPLMRKVVTLSGGAVKNPGNYKVRLGMSHKDLIELTGGFKDNPVKIISGGPMMGASLFDLSAPIVKTSPAIICLTGSDTQKLEETNCIRCGQCVETCPMYLMPLELNRFAKYNDNISFEKYRGMDCIECGCCSYVCPAKRHMAQSIRAAKQYIRLLKRREEKNA